MNLRLKDCLNGSFIHTVHTFIHRLSISLSSEPLELSSFPLGLKQLYFSVRDRGIGPLLTDWQPVVLPLY